MEYFGLKQPAEEYYVSFEFTKDLGSEDVDSAEIVIVDQAADPPVDLVATLSDPAKQNNTGKIAYVWVRAGASGKNYKITCKITGTAGSLYELEGVLPVKEK